MLCILETHTYLVFNNVVPRPNSSEPTQKVKKRTSQQRVTFLQHPGILGDRTDHAAKVVAVERRLDQGLVIMELDRALGCLTSRLAVIKGHVQGRSQPHSPGWARVPLS